MQVAVQTSPITTRTRWIGHILSGIMLLFMLMDSVMKLFNPSFVVETMVALGYPADISPMIGVVALICVALAAIPQTAVLGAILLTGYLGGAIATHVRAGSEPFSIVFPIILGVLLWGGLYLRDARLRALIPLRS